MITLKHILHPTDFSEPAGQALEYAIALCDRFGADLHALHILPNQTVVPVGPGGFAAQPATGLQPEYRKQAAALLDNLVSRDWERNHTIHRVTREGTAFLGIIDYAKEAEIDLIVMGTHGRGALAHMLMGSVAEKTVRKAPCPVLTVRPEGHQFVMP